MDQFFGNNLKHLRKSKGLTLSEMADSIGFSSSQWNNWELGTSFPKFLDLIQISKYFGLTETELIHSELKKGKDSTKSTTLFFSPKGKDLGKDSGKDSAVLDRKTPKSTGENSPFLVPKNLGLPHVVVTDLKGNENIVHVPVKARAGYLIGYGDPQYVESPYSYNLPGFKHGTYRSFEVDGQSMKPTLLHRDWVVGEWVESFDDIRENRIHIIVTKNDGILIKRVLNRISERNKLYLKSDTITQKKDYPVIELDPNEIAEIWYARIRFSPDFSEPSEIYTRVDNLEIAMYELQKLNGIKPV